MFFSAPPSQPQQFVVRATTSRTVTLQWAAPRSDGGSPVTSQYINYITNVLKFNIVVTQKIIYKDKVHC